MRRQRAETSRNADDGFTLIEVIIAVVVLAGITAAITAIMITSMSGSRSTTQRVRESNDTQLISAFLVRDAQAAGGTNPSTAAADSSLGVRRDAEFSECADPMSSPVIGFKWIDRTSLTAKVTHVANFYVKPSANELVRRICDDTASPGTVAFVGELTLGRHVLQALASCEPVAACPAASSGFPDSIRLDITETNNPVNRVNPVTGSPEAYSYSLTAALRPEGQTPPTGSTGAQVPLLALGASACVNGTTGLRVQGTTDVSVNGGVIVNATDVGACAAMTTSGGSDWVASGGTDILQGGSCGGNPTSCAAVAPSPFQTPVGDPFAELAPPTGTCGAGGNPGPVSGSYPPGVYNTSVTLGNGTHTFPGGTYIFCNGLAINSGAVVNGSGVQFYIAGGTFTINGQSTLSLTGLAPDLPMIWLPGSGSLTINGGTTIDSYAGLIYAPNTNVTIEGGAGLTIGSIIARTISFAGNSGIGVGPPLPVTITTTSVPDGTVGITYPTTTLTRSGGTAPFTWAITAGALPDGVSLSAGGVLSGMPSVVNTFNFTVQVTDATGGTDTQNLTIVIAAAPAGPVPTNVVLGTNNGSPGAGDTVTVTYSAALNPQTLCNGWGTSGSQTLNGNNVVTVAITDTGTNDTLTVTSSTCTFHLGSIALGGNYVSQNKSYAGNGGNRSTIQWNEAARTLTITLGAQNNGNGVLSVAAPGGTPVYSPDPAITDTAGAAIDPAAFTAPGSSRL